MVNPTLYDEEELLALARFDLDREDMEGALAKIKVILTRGASSVEVFALAGKTYASLGLFQKAKFSFERFLEKIPEAFVELFQLGMVEKDMGNYAEARAVWCKVLELSEHYPPALYHLAVLDLNENSMDDAKMRLNQILQYAPDGNEYIKHADQLLTRISLQ